MLKKVNLHGKSTGLSLICSFFTLFTSGLQVNELFIIDINIDLIKINLYFGRMFCITVFLKYFT